MYILKNALRCISRSKGRNILIGIIVLTISIAACIGLSIKQAAITAKETAADNLSVTATISFDRQNMMSQMTPPDKNSMGDMGEFDKDAFKDMMGSASSLSLAEYKTFATASSVDDFYYSATASFNAGEGIEPVSNSSDDSDDSSNSSNQGFGGFGGNMFGGGMPMGSQSDFQVIGYSSEKAMTDFMNETASITDGTIFEEGTSDYVCVISQELATYNSLSVDDEIKLVNPNSEEEIYTLKIVGIYTSTSSNEQSFMGGFRGTSDPANEIYTSFTLLNSITSASETLAETSDSDAISSIINATYSFKDVESYEKFEEECRNLGLSEDYSISSQDVASFESSLVPLNTLSTMAGWFLIVILIIGAIILIVLNIFSVRERKYEIGVLTAMGMKKFKVALQFLTEIFAVTLSAVIIGACVGAVLSVPVTNALLENQISSQSQQSNRIEGNFGRGEFAPGGNGGNSEAPPNMPGGFGGFGGFENISEFFGGATNYVSEINSAMNLTVVLQMLGIAVLLTLAAGAVSMLFIMRYEPLKILANRD